MNFEEEIVQTDMENDVLFEKVIAPPVSIRRKNWLKRVGALLVIILLINAYFLFKKDSIVERAYYIDPQLIEQPSNYSKVVETEGVIAPQSVLQLNAIATELEEISVKEGQVIYKDDQLAIYNEKAKEQAVMNVENELDGLNVELSGLEKALREVEKQSSQSPSTSEINSNQLTEYVSVEVQMEINQYHTSSEAIAVLKQHIAEVDGKIATLEKKLTALNETRAIISPMNGSIGKITIDGGTVTFEIHSSDKNIVSYLHEEEWKEVALENTVAVTHPDYEEKLYGEISEKQELPAYESLWLDQLKDENKIKEDERVYEIRSNISELFTNVPYGSRAKAMITTYEAINEFIVPSSWVVEKEIENVSDEHIYVIGYDGRLRLQPVTVSATGKLSSWKAVHSEEIPKEVNDYAKTQLSIVKKEAKKEEDKELSTITSPFFENDVIFTESGEKIIYSPTYLPLTIEKLDWSVYKTYTWKDYLKYLVK